MTAPTGNGDAAMALCEQVLELVGTRGEAVVRASAGQSSLTRFANSRIHQNVSEDTGGVSLQVTVAGGRTASASGNHTDQTGLTALVERALAAAVLRPEDPEWPGLAGPAPARGADHWDDETAGASARTRAEAVGQFVGAGDGLEAAGFCSTSWSEVALANSAGQRLAGRSTVASISGIQRAIGPDGKADGSGDWSSSRVRELDAAAAGRLAATRAVASTAAEDIGPGHYEVVLEPDCVSDMVQFLSFGFSGKAHAEGTSFAHPGEAQFDPAFSMWDDAADERSIGLNFDAEGTPSALLNLVKGGVTGDLAHDRRSAARAGVQSTGHATGSTAFGAFPMNVIVGEGGDSVDELISEVEHGLLVCGFWYTRILDPKTQVVTGLTRNGLFRIDEGKVGAAVRNLRFTQSYAAALGAGRVLGIGNDGRRVGRYWVPSLRLSDWNFTGGAQG
ncbi:MAG TPA: TldD/PmbA family protein [Acidimicrobiales bacterium]|nr:TldD/PmbA family protein [Acidimicrobiales bacterium]